MYIGFSALAGLGNFSASIGFAGVDGKALPDLLGSGLVSLRVSVLAFVSFDLEFGG
jgi:hypothetical protein